MSNLTVVAFEIIIFLMSVEAVIDLMNKLSSTNLRFSDIRGAQEQADRLIDVAINGRGNRRWSPLERAALYTTRRIIALSPIWRKYGYGEEAA